MVSSGKIFRIVLPVTCYTGTKIVDKKGTNVTNGVMSADYGFTKFEIFKIIVALCSDMLLWLLVLLSIIFIVIPLIVLIVVVVIVIVVIIIIIFCVILILFSFLMFVLLLLFIIFNIVTLGAPVWCCYASCMCCVAALKIKYES